MQPVTQTREKVLPAREGGEGGRGAGLLGGLSRAAQAWGSGKEPKLQLLPAEISV